MASLFRSTELTVTGSFEMTGVPTAIMVQTIRDFGSTPSFLPDLLELEFVRGGGPPVQVGTCWNEKRAYGNGVMMVRRTITKLSETPPLFEVCMSFEVVEAHWSTPTTEGTFTITVVPPCENEDPSRSCAIRWGFAFLSKGLYGRILSALCLPCLKREFIANATDEWQQYYIEALRRTAKAALEKRTETTTNGAED